MKKMLFFLFVCLCNANLQAKDFKSKECFNKLINNKNFMSSINAIIKDGTENLTDIKSKEEQAKDNIIENKNRITELFAEYMFNKPGYCYKDIIKFAKKEEDIKLRFKLKIKEDLIPVDLNININELFDYIQEKYTLFIYNKNKHFGDIVKNLDIKSNYWSKECSSKRTNDSEAVNIAGQTVFNNKEDEFYLSSGDRPFYGLIMIDKNELGEDYIFIIKHLPTALKLLEDFSKKLQNSACSNQGLSVYLVKINNDKKASDANLMLKQTYKYSVSPFLVPSVLTIGVLFFSSSILIDSITIMSEPYFIR